MLEDCCSTKSRELDLRRLSLQERDLEGRDFLHDFLLLVLLDGLDPRANLGFFRNGALVKTAKGLVGDMGKVAKLRRRLNDPRWVRTERTSIIHILAL